MKIEFFMPMEPPTVTAQQHRIGKTNTGKTIVYDTPELKLARAKLMAHLAKHKPEKPFRPQVPVELLVEWCFPTTMPAHDGQYRTSKPDTDNLQKLLKDCMTKTGFWKDDAQVCREVVEKFWSMTPGIFIRVSELEA